MCLYCEQLQLVTDLCDHYNAAQVISTTNFSIVIAVGDTDVEEPVAVINRSQQLHADLRLANFTAHQFTGRVQTNRKYICVLYNVMPGTRPNDHLH